MDLNNLKIELETEKHKNAKLSIALENLEKINSDLKKKLDIAEEDRRKLNEIIGNLSIEKAEFRSKLRKAEARIAEFENH